MTIWSFSSWNCCCKVSWSFSFSRFSLSTSRFNSSIFSFSFVNSCSLVETSISKSDRTFSNSTYNFNHSLITANGNVIPIQWITIHLSIASSWWCRIEWHLILRNAAQNKCHLLQVLQNFSRICFSKNCIEWIKVSRTQKEMPIVNKFWCLLSFIYTLPRAPARADSLHASPHSHTFPPAPSPCRSSQAEELRTYHLSLCACSDKPPVRSECPPVYSPQPEIESESMLLRFEL